MRHKCPAFERARNRATSALEAMTTHTQCLPATQPGRADRIHRPAELLHAGGKMLNHLVGGLLKMQNIPQMVPHVDPIASRVGKSEGVGVGSREGGTVPGLPPTPPPWTMETVTAGPARSRPKRDMGGFARPRRSSAPSISETLGAPPVTLCLARCRGVQVCLE
jgi:hypothetical protein